MSSIPKHSFSRCPGLTGGAIASPSFPLNYPNKARVHYELETYKDSRIRLQFEVFDLEESSKCFDADYLSVSGSGRYYCGQDLPGPFVSVKSTMSLTFESDILENRQGFLATWTEVKATNVIEGQTQGEFRTPNYPKKYPRNAYVTQTFDIPDGAKVEFKVLDFRTENCCDKFCINNLDKDYFPASKVVAAFYIFSTLLILKQFLQCYCGRVTSIPTFEKDSKSRYFTISFRSDSTAQQRGFNIQWKLV